MRSIRRALLLLALLATVISAEDKRCSIYTPTTSYSLAVVDRGGREYVGLLEALEPLGTVSAAADGNRWRLRFNRDNAEFTGGQTRGRIKNKDYDLPAPFLLENGRGLVPLSSLGTLVPRFVGSHATLHESARRVFLGNTSVRFSTELLKGQAGSLVFNFSSPVNPTIATEPGRLRMVFAHEPVMSPNVSTLSFDDRNISKATYSEHNGSAEIAVDSAVPLFARFSNGNRSITLSPAPTAAQATPQPATTPSAPAIPAQGTTPATTPAAQPAPPVPASAPRVFAVIDAGHGGGERGASLSNGLAEKDVTLAFAQVLKQEFESRGISVLLIRSSDTALSLDQRSGAANAAYPAIYVALHASSEGVGNRILTALLPSAGEARGLFPPWETAQSNFLGVSQAAATGVLTELHKKGIAARILSAPLRPLNNITGAAIAVELAPSGADATELASQSYQQNVAAAVAAGIAATRDRLEAGR
jgi:N-acetylmuramoyl-L-alanine amidase